LTLFLKAKLAKYEKSSFQNKQNVNDGKLKLPFQVAV
jgi:hypothetical protein